MTKIEWTEKTWNPIVGCSIVSPGCTNCYAMRMAARLERMSPGLTHYHGLTKSSKAGPVWTGKVALAPERILTAPLRRKRPTMYFVNSMGDLFHEDVPDEWIDRVFAVMALCPQHTFQVLTKRASRMRAYFNRVVTPHFDAQYREDIEWDRAHEPMKPTEFAIGTHVLELARTALEGQWVQLPILPLANVWLGVSAERQQEADERIPDLLATPAAVRFISAEPLLGPIDFTRLNDGPAPGTINALTGDAYCGRGDRFPVKPFPPIDWIIVGGESGPDARPMHPDWARSIRDQCEAAGVAFFFKQWGNHHPIETHPQLVPIGIDGVALLPTGDAAIGPGYHGATFMARVGKSRAGRLLDGRTHDAMPDQRAESTPEAAA